MFILAFKIEIVSAFCFSLLTADDLIISERVKTYAPIFRKSSFVQLKVLLSYT